MKKLIFISALLIMSGLVFSQDNDYLKQLRKNANIGWDSHKNENYRWRNFSIGTAITGEIEAIPKTSWRLGMNINWSKYTLYRNGFYSQMPDKHTVIRTNSFSFPAYAVYEISDKQPYTMNLYTGPVYELIYHTNLQTPIYDGISPSQLGWTFGTNVRLWRIIGVRLAYTSYASGLFNNGNLNRSAVSFSIGF